MGDTGGCCRRDAGVAMGLICHSLVRIKKNNVGIFAQSKVNTKNNHVAMIGFNLKESKDRKPFTGNPVNGCEYSLVASLFDKM